MTLEQQIEELTKIYELYGNLNVIAVTRRGHKRDIESIECPQQSSSVELHLY